MLFCFSPLGGVVIFVFAGENNTSEMLPSAVYLSQLHLSTSVRSVLLQSCTWTETRSFYCFWTICDVCLFLFLSLLSFPWEILSLYIFTQETWLAKWMSWYPWEVILSLGYLAEDFACEKTGWLSLLCVHCFFSTIGVPSVFLLYANWKVVLFWSLSLYLHLESGPKYVTLLV